MAGKQDQKKFAISNDKMDWKSGLETVGQFKLQNGL